MAVVGEIVVTIQTGTLSSRKRLGIITTEDTEDHRGRKYSVLLCALCGRYPLSFTEQSLFIPRSVWPCYSEVFVP
jgi:hypothetical protein